jgi:hypothetical protein
MPCYQRQFLRRVLVANLEFVRIKMPGIALDAYLRS